MKTHALVPVANKDHTEDQIEENVNKNANNNNSEEEEQEEEESEMETLNGFRISKERIKVTFKAVPKPKEYVREVDEQTYREYKQKLKKDKARKERIMNLTEEDK